MAQKKISRGVNRSFVYKYECPCCGKLTTYPQRHYINIHKGELPTSFKSYKMVNYPKKNKKIDNPTLEVCVEPKQKRSRPTMDVRGKNLNIQRITVHVGEFMETELVLNPRWTPDNEELFFANPY